MISALLGKDFLPICSLEIPMAIADQVVLHFLAKSLSHDTLFINS